MRTVQTQFFEVLRESLATLSYTLNHENTQKAVSKGAQFV